GGGGMPAARGGDGARRGGAQTPAAARAVPLRPPPAPGRTRRRDISLVVYITSGEPGTKEGNYVLLQTISRKASARVYPAADRPAAGSCCRLPFGCLERRDRLAGRGR